MMIQHVQKLLARRAGKSMVGAPAGMCDDITDSRIAAVVWRGNACGRVFGHITLLLPPI